MACVLESAATDDLGALGVLHAHAFPVERGLEAALLAGRTGLLDLLASEHDDSCAPLAPELWLAAARGARPFHCMDRLRRLDARVPAQPNFLRRLYAQAAAIGPVRWVRQALIADKRLPALTAEHLGAAAAAGRTTVLRWVIEDDRSLGLLLSANATSSSLGPGTGGARARSDGRQALADALLLETARAPVFPLATAALLCRGQLARPLPAVSATGRCAALCAAAGRADAQRFLLESEGTPWPAWLLPALAAAADDAGCAMLLDARALMFAAAPEENHAEAPYCDGGGGGGVARHHRIGWREALADARGHLEMRLRYRRDASSSSPTAAAASTAADSARALHNRLASLLIEHEATAATTPLCRRRKRLQFDNDATTQENKTAAVRAAADAAEVAAAAAAPSTATSAATEKEEGAAVIT